MIKDLVSAEATNPSKHGEGLAKKEPVYQRQVKQTENALWKVKENRAVSGVGSSKSGSSKFIN